MTRDDDRLATLTDGFREIAIEAFERMNADDELRGMGIKHVFVVEGRRALPTQMAYFSRSRMAPANVLAMYRAAGLAPITGAEALRPVTWTLDSKHLAGLSMDLAPSRDGRTIWWGAPPEVWHRMGLIGQAYGLECGLDWPADKKDPGHYETKRTA